MCDLIRTNGLDSITDGLTMGVRRGGGGGSMGSNDHPPPLCKVTFTIGNFFSYRVLVIYIHASGISRGRGGCSGCLSTPLGQNCNRLFLAITYFRISDLKWTAPPLFVYRPEVDCPPPPPPPPPTFHMGPDLKHPPR